MVGHLAVELADLHLLPLGEVLVLTAIQDVVHQAQAASAGLSRTAALPQARPQRRDGVCEKVERQQHIRGEVHPEQARAQPFQAKLVRAHRDQHVHGVQRRENEQRKPRSPVRQFDDVCQMVHQVAERTVAFPPFERPGIRKPLGLLAKTALGFRFALRHALVRTNAHVSHSGRVAQAPCRPSSALVPGRARGLPPRSCARRGTLRGRCP